MYNKSPFFSVVIPTYNRPEMAWRAVQSVLMQNVGDFEIIVVDDGSVMEYNEFKERIKGCGQVKYFKKKNAGPSKARNFGLGKSQGSFICFLDDDDEFLPLHLQTLFDCIRLNNFTAGLYHTLTYFRKDGVLTKQAFRKTSQDLKPVEKIFSNIFGTCNACVSSEILAKMNFNSLPISEDFDLWARICLRYPLFEIEEYTTIYDLHGENTSAYDSESVHIKHIRAFEIMFSNPELRKELPKKYRAELFQKRYLWLSAAQRKKGKVVSAWMSRVKSEYYSLSL